ncbi:peptidylprolyl isomerase [Akkermansiaceae bacterium]|nr:peptidylprolyl isomerase [Akkermansiaceae bacterium]MDB4436034.1 peptidylprolyl isomerase [Akkermansiaceae bacterium]
MKLLIVLALSLLALSDASSQIIAKVDTNLRLHPDNDENFETRFFYVQLNHELAPLATANFMLLSGIENEEWLGTVGEILPAPHLPYSPIRKGRGYTRDGRLPLNILFQEAAPGVPGDVDKYIVRQNTTIFAILDTTPFGNVYKSLIGDSRVELHRDPIANRFKIIINHERKWLDSRFFGVRSHPMYRNIPVTKIEPGLRFISGSFTNQITDGPGYTFPDELNKISGAGTPWRTDFTTNGWTLAMDSIGPNANGSRFFFTGQPTTQNVTTLSQWNSRYTAFGTVLTDAGGRNVVNDILNFSTTEDGSPQGSIRITNISFIRLGNTELGFFPHLLLDQLPEDLSTEQLDIKRIGSNYFLNGPPSPASQRVFLTSADLLSPPIVFSTYIKPFDFTPTSENITQNVRQRPSLFFRSYISRLQNWPAQDFDFSGTQITCANVTAAGAISGQVRFTFAEALTPAQEGTFGTYLIILPARAVDTGQGIVQYPAVSRTGTFNSQLIDDENPYRVRLLLDPPDTQNPEIPFMPFDEFILHMDYQRVRLLENRVSRFTAINSADPFRSINGFWQKTN